MNGSSGRDGRVEVCLESMWTALFSFRLDRYTYAAQVVCRQLDLPYQCKFKKTSFISVIPGVDLGGGLLLFSGRLSRF